ncbi:hypothetical protein BH09PSE4_BH09PSE4_08840 [soil metagenome]
MDRAEKAGLGLATLGHVALFGLLSAGFLATPNPLKLKQEPLDVSLVSEVALESAAPQTTEEPAQSVAPERGAPEDAAPPAPAEAKPAPAAPAPPPKPAPVSRPQKPVPPAKAASQDVPKPVAGKPTRTAATGSMPGSSATRPRGSRLGDDFLKGITDRPTPSKAQTPRGAQMSAQAAASIGQAILRQIQPCADRQVTPGPGAERIRVTVRLRINRDGSLAARPAIVDHVGVDGGNERYATRVDDLAIATFVGCSPLRGLPPELYDVPNGWKDFSLRYKLPG